MSSLWLVLTVLFVFQGKFVSLFITFSIFISKDGIYSQVKALSVVSVQVSIIKNFNNTKSEIEPSNFSCSSINSTIATKSTYLHTLKTTKLTTKIQKPTQVTTKFQKSTISTIPKAEAIKPTASKSKTSGSNWIKFPTAWFLILILRFNVVM